MFNLKVKNWKENNYSLSGHSGEILRQSNNNIYTANPNREA